MIAAIADHLWQSTLFAGAAVLLTLALRRQGARVRHAVLMAATVKFLLPFALLTAAVHWAAGALHAPTAPLDLSLLRRVAEPVAAFAAAPSAKASGPAMELDGLLIGAWLIGVAAVTAVRIRQWIRLRGIVRAAKPLTLAAPVPVLAANPHDGPALAGLLRPVLLLPRGLREQLSEAEFDSVIAHELQHLKRRDNATVLAPMAVQALFWFHPLAWWLHKRLLAEREQACDEAVLGSGADPQAYASGLLKVCRLYLQPQPPAAAAAGDDLKARVRRIMQGAAPAVLRTPQRLLLASASAAALALPVMAGLAGPRTAAVLLAPVAAIAAAVQIPERRPEPEPSQAAITQPPHAQLVKVVLASEPVAVKATLDLAPPRAEALQLARAPTLPSVQPIQAESRGDILQAPSLPEDAGRIAGALSDAYIMRTGDWSGRLSVRAASACPVAEVRHAVDRLQGMPVSTAFDGMVRRFVADTVAGRPDPASLTPAFNRSVQHSLQAVQPALGRFAKPAAAGLLGEDANARDLYLVPSKEGSSYALVLVDDEGRILGALFCDA